VEKRDARNSEVKVVSKPDETVKEKRGRYKKAWREKKRESVS